MTRGLRVAHQLGADLHDWLRARLPANARIEALPAEDPWRVPDSVDVLLAANGTLRRLARTKPAWARSLAWVHSRATGLDAAPDWLFDVPHLTVSRGASAPAIAEYVLAAMLDFETGWAGLRATGPADWGRRARGGLRGRALGLVGYGEIGRAVADRARGFDMTLRAARRTPEPAPGVELVPFAELCAQSDHLVLCAPLTDATRGLFDAAAFARCRPGQHLVNVARGALVVPDALRAALDGPIARATLDVWPEEPPPAGHWIYAHPRVVLTPHCASHGPGSEARMQAILDANLTAWLADRPEALQGRVSPSRRY